MKHAQPIPCDLLIVNGKVLTLDSQDRRIRQGAVAVSDGVILDVGDTADLLARTRPHKVLDAEGCVVLPGLVNAHTHAAMTLFRGLADDLPLMDWLQHHIFPAEKKLTEDWVYWGTLLACAEMILSGTTCFCDMYLFEHKVAQAADEAGMRALVGEVLYDFPSPHYGPLENGLRFTQDLIAEWKDHPLVRIAVEPHAPYTCSPDLIRACFHMAESHGVPMVIHLSENQAEVEEILRRYGKRPVAHLAELGVLSDRVIADHCVAVDEDDMDLLARHGVHVVHNPESNLKLTSGIAPVPALLERGVNVALGTDGCASNNNLDLLAEMDVCAKIHKAAAQDPTVLDARTVLNMATACGARALGFGDGLGRIQAGAPADLIVVDFRKPHLTPVYDPVSHLVYAAQASDVRHSVIAGRVVMEDRQLLTLDVERICAHVRTIAEKVR
ncbi:5-methylthioadenosine/S-adenosylhomocysteine deaminase [Desulfacinum hydrothermale DSM 13146]|uniref:5-methylthioadenosine/S-adenosylhomocysteine deaminase n=1 Tax=Desulfacinum hydrothermale DSM 13146 TaxID=1121390 RepID=A0A1W1X462_9BACT|nr:amidohydrolase [Desulfacinum hydrothermale]SMC18759.1 5-methylthioadenosine/S-adenosylhomocysteine deaminase [Desulfacinum hydrothermale DSM 13146]